MLRYTEFGLSHIEVPEESSICIYISGCLNHCKDCHYPELQLEKYGEPLKKYFCDIIDLYKSQATCVCFLGEGDLSEESKNELLEYVKKIKLIGLKSCLYSGKDTKIEKWMQDFDYIKIGSYKKEFGTLYDLKTNQKMYQKTHIGFKDITNKFWN